MAMAPGTPASASIGVAKADATGPEQPEHRAGDGTGEQDQRIGHAPITPHRQPEVQDMF